jgi:hypothetical protein
LSSAGVGCTYSLGGGGEACEGSNKSVGDLHFERCANSGWRRRFLYNDVENQSEAGSRGEDWSGT